ncbi:sensor histidine kinase [Streptomyces clavuligerus]|uniref:sensor histidine kinase n=3 Tax=Streptomyces clavuligerus TaxID=1901 RepID=UPI001E30C4C6|nr:histidine kinase dimerization/phospho-acceptor domain-containing protein [Streptomyces clavuligerus]
MRRRWAGWSLRTRLVALTVVLLTLVLTAIPLITGLVVEASLHAELDDRVNKLAVVLRAEDERRQRHRGTDPTRCPAGGSGRDGLGFIRSAGTLFGTVGVETRDGEVIDGAVLDRAREGLRPLTGEQSAAVADMPPDRGPRTRTVPGLGDYRLIAHRAHGGEVMITGLPMGEVENTVSRFLTVHAGVSVGGIVLVGLAAAAAVSLTLRPLRRIAQTATRVSEQTLHKGEVAELERVPEGDTRPGTEAGQVGAALNRLLDHVGAALSARHASETRVRQFVADASHELRTPLASIRGYAELTRRSGERPPPRTAHALRRVESEADRMTSLVEDLLLLARLDSGRPLAPAPVELSALVIDAVSDARAVGPEHRWRLELPDEPVRVEADPDRLLQILVNLLANARAHTPAGTTVTVSVHEERGGHPAHGPGVPLVPRGRRR